jgi:N-acetylmuramoyl-L-alanine amidase
MATLERLATDILARHAIPARNVVGHSDVAPTRKTDPGELFDWRRLAAAGIGLWPEANAALETESSVDEPGVLGFLKEYGYDVAEPTAAIVAFQRHFARHRLDGVADQATRRTLAALVALTKT